MKALLVVLMIAVLVMPAFSQEEKTLISGKIESGGFGGPVLKASQINGESSLLMGGRGGWIINHTLVLGGGGYGLVTDIKAPNTPADSGLYLQMGYGGFEIEYVSNSDALVHYSLHSLIGAGGVSFREKDWDESEEMGDTFFIAEPGANLELNVTKFFRIGAGASYRYISGVNYRGVSNSDLSGWSGNLTLKFGKF
jgi:hypothetical protein